MPLCCNNRTNYKAEPHPRGNGWERVTCRKCGKWIGDRQKDKQGRFMPAFSPNK